MRPEAARLGIEPRTRRLDDAKRRLDRAFADVLARPGELVDAAAHAVGLPELCEQLVKRAQRSGQLRPDLTWEDIPMIACGLGRITQTTVGPASGRWPRLVEIILDGLRSPGSGRLPRCP